MKIDYLYGTAWKEETTADCVYRALESGFRAIDTANQRKHYYEIGVGEAILKGYELLNLKREELFIQTKFTYVGGQDNRIPYDPNDPYHKQVADSFKSSLDHLHTDYLDSYILHGPNSSGAINQADTEVWLAMENLYKEGKVKNLGVSNVDLRQLISLYEFANIKPHFIQIRCFAVRGWERDLREFCRKHQITFQGFSLLTANREYLGPTVFKNEKRKSPQMEFLNQLDPMTPIGRLVAETGKTPAQIVFKFCHQVGILPITGTTTTEHMKMNLDINDFSLSSDQLKLVENIAFLRSEG